MLSLGLIEMYVCLCVCASAGERETGRECGLETQWITKASERWREAKFVWMCMKMCATVFAGESECVMRLGS